MVSTKQENRNTINYPQTTRNLVGHHYELPPVSKHRVTEWAKPDVREQLVDISHVHCIERVEEVPQVRTVLKPIPVPKFDVTERVMAIPNHVKEQKTVEIPYVHVVDHVVEVPQVIVQQKVVEVPKLMLQERIIPIPKRTIEERIVEIPEEDFQRILGEKTERNVLDGRKTAGEKQEAYNGTVDPEITKANCDQKIGVPLSEALVTSHPGGHVVTEVPHIQHEYRNIMEPVYRHIPKPVEIPLTHYRPVPIERVIDRNVPIPVELEVVQEFLCPRIEAKYYDVPVPIPVTRIVEKPVPSDAMFNSVIMDAYMNGTPPSVTPCVQLCGAGQNRVAKAKMTPAELQAAGINQQPSVSQVPSFKSRGPSVSGVALDRSRNFFLQQRTLLQEQKKSVEASAST